MKIKGNISDFVNDIQHKSSTAPTEIRSTPVFDPALKNLIFSNKRLKRRLMRSPQSSQRTNSLRTKQRLLSSTERLFASRGFAGVTMREVAERAQTNIASAHYHFGSKEGMVLEMLKRRIEPINANRLKYLEQSRSLAGESPLSGREIFRALILPISHEISKSMTSRQILAQLVARSFTEPARFIEKMHRRFFGELSEIFINELQRTYPNASKKELYWNLHFVISSMLGTLAQHRRLHDFSRGYCDESDVENMCNRLIDFVSSGFETGISPALQ
jgi:AcrR family transcriptional regulator